MSFFFNYDGNFFKSGDPVLSPDNRGFRYGDGLFETMRVENGRIILKDFHFERLYSGLKTLQFPLANNFDKTWLESLISHLLSKNSHHESARIRLTVFRGDGTLDTFDKIHFIIQSWKIDPLYKKKEGIKIFIYNNTHKNYDKF